MALEISDEILGIFVPIIIYWVYSGIYVILESFEKYKLHSKKEENEKNLVSRFTVVKGVLLQQTFQAIVVFLLFKVMGENDAGESKGESTSSSIFVIARQIVVAMLVLDTYQYFTHRYMHHNKFLYRNFHSYHHRLVVPYSFGALYSHQVDGFLFDTMGGALAAFLSGMSPRTSIFFFCFATIKTIDDHCGILFPGNPFHIFFWNNTAFHDVHHQLHGIYMAFGTSLDKYKLHSEEDEKDKNLVSRGQVLRGVLLSQTLQAFGAFFFMFLYRHVHSRHHRMVVSYAFGAQYTHPLEGLLLDTFGGGLAFIISGMSPRSSIFFFSISSIKIVDDHCGFRLPGNPFHMFFKNNAVYHDVHHQIYGAKYNFSFIFVIWDKILGTYMPYSLEKKIEGGFQVRPAKEFKDE
ncbi:Fatty acid hydroxylase [Corchorus capsularis]|uniref:Fatty acid hydroxylase n=1 Tax=Corchorus capsularis TaxID=210143 RepID=A0A1R3I8W4_COCAP|nr:Fatty acid hydroxylase [Corchorus capsularis]